MSHRAACQFHVVWPCGSVPFAVTGNGRGTGMRSRPAGDSLANSLALAKDGAEHLSPDTGKASDKDIL